MSRFQHFLFIFLVIACILADSDKRESTAQDPSLTSEAIDIVRVEIEWLSSTDTYRFAYAVIEKSGTSALLERTKHLDPFGSYRGILVDANTAQPLYYNSLGTGQEYRKLVRSFTFRFPIPDNIVEFQMIAENPQTGNMEKVLSHNIDPKSITRLNIHESSFSLDDLEIRKLKEATKLPKLIVNIYAEGYLAHRDKNFWQDAPKVVQSLKNKNFPLFEHLEFYGVFAPSKQALGQAKKLGFPIPERDSFLGLYYPYWNDFGRWYHIVYPTRETRFRQNIGLVPYDYPIALIDSDSYWGVGNFKELTAIPSRNSNFTYLLMHEFGHYFGLNEEYNGGGKTELAFAPGIREPWSPNITFLNDKNNVKWQKFMEKGIPIPTPENYWNGMGPYGAYKGGYAETEPLGRSYKPGFACIMDRGDNFCKVCEFAIQERIHFDLGLPNNVHLMVPADCCTDK